MTVGSQFERSKNMEENKVEVLEEVTDGIDNFVEEAKNTDDLSPAETSEDDGVMLGMAILVGAWALIGVGAGALIGVGVDRIIIPGIKKGKQAIDGFLAKRKEKKDAKEIEKLIKRGYKVSVEDEELEDFEELDEETENTEN